MPRVILWLGDPLHKLPRHHRAVVYTLATLYVARLAIWYGIEDQWGQP